MGTLRAATGIGEFTALAAMLHIARECRTLGIAACALQRKIGDFYLKVLIGHIGSGLLIHAAEFGEKADRVRVASTSSYEPVSCPADTPEPVDALALFIGGFRELGSTARAVVRHARAVSDWPLERLAGHFVTSLRGWSRQLAQWQALSPTPATELNAHLGLLRDCELVTTPRRAPADAIWLGNVDLESVLLRSWYLSGNAYLEITTVDIVSDLILEAEAAGMPSLVRDLAYQLLDEARHSEMLARNLERLGAALGCVPVSLKTWALYRACGSISEKLAAQHVIQESVGLDVSASNVRRMRLAGDEPCAQMFLKITSDECAHLALGVSWLRRLEGEEAAATVGRVRRLAEEISPPPVLPVVPELRLAAGYPGDWLANEIASRGSMNLNELIEERSGRFVDG